MEEEACWCTRVLQVPVEDDDDEALMEALGAGDTALVAVQGQERTFWCGSRLTASLFY